MLILTPSPLTLAALALCCEPSDRLASSLVEMLGGSMGDKAVPLLNGMFAFAYWNLRLLASQRLGLV